MRNDLTGRVRRARARSRSLSSHSKSTDTHTGSPARVPKADRPAKIRRDQHREICVRGKGMGGSETSGKNRMQTKKENVEWKHSKKRRVSVSKGGRRTDTHTHTHTRETDERIPNETEYDVREREGGKERRLRRTEKGQQREKKGGQRKARRGGENDNSEGKIQRERRKDGDASNEREAEQKGLG